MNRRFWIKGAVLVAGGFVFFPSCTNPPDHASIPLNNINVDRDDELLLAELVETIIPATDTLGAKNLNLQLFVLRMIDDCYQEKEQKAYINGLKLFGGYSEKITGQSFSDSSSAQKLSLVKHLTASDAAEKDLRFFLSTTKQLTILGYTESKYVMTKLVPYELIPGRFYGCIKIKQST